MTNPSSKSSDTLHLFGFSSQNQMSQVSTCYAVSPKLEAHTQFTCEAQLKFENHLTMLVNIDGVCITGFSIYKYGN